VRVNPQNNIQEDPFKDLPAVQKVTRKVAIAVAFAGVFIWFLKVVFGIPG
jgi:hypothetical protein